MQWCICIMFIYLLSWNETYKACLVVVQHCIHGLDPQGIDWPVQHQPLLIGFFILQAATMSYSKGRHGSTNKTLQDSVCLPFNHALCKLFTVQFQCCFIMLLLLHWLCGKFVPRFLAHPPHDGGQHAIRPFHHGCSIICAVKLIPRQTNDTRPGPTVIRWTSRTFALLQHNISMLHCETW